MDPRTMGRIITAAGSIRRAAMRRALASLRPRHVVRCAVSPAISFDWAHCDGGDRTHHDTSGVRVLRCRGVERRGGMAGRAHRERP